MNLSPSPRKAFSKAAQSGNVKRDVLKTGGETLPRKRSPPSPCSWSLVSGFMRADGRFRRPSLLPLLLLALRGLRAPFLPDESDLVEEEVELLSLRELHLDPGHVGEGGLA